MNTVSLSINGSLDFDHQDGEPTVMDGGLEVSSPNEEINDKLVLKALSRMFRDLADSHDEEIEKMEQAESEEPEQECTASLIEDSNNLIDWINLMDSSVHVVVPDDVKVAALKLQLLALKDLSEELRAMREDDE